MRINRSKYREYKLEQIQVSGKLDTEFDFFINTDNELVVEEEAPEFIETEFISDIELSGDFHDILINNEIQIAFQDATTDIILIPNYQTLEVMLVERGLTYDAIRVQTNIDVFIYDDLNIMDDRSDEYTNIIRYESGYTPTAPFVRDPGDYIDGDDYDEQVYQKQIWQEKIREQFEGGMVVRSRTYANAIRSLSMMIYGEWRPVSYEASFGVYPEIKTLEYYNYINGLELEYNTTAEPYDDDSVLNVMIDEGVIYNLRDTRDSNSPIFTDFPRYTWQGRENGQANSNYVQQSRYQQYINETNNDVFDLEYMQPYEPVGSILYYNEYAPWQEIS